MGNPITWQNVNGPSLADASRPLDSAARAFDMGFGALRTTLDQSNRIDDQNYQTGIKNNTNAFLDKLAQYRTVDELNAAQKSGAIDQLRASFGTQIDANAARSGFDQRLNGLMTQQKQGIEFDNLMKDNNSMPFMQAYKTASLRGDKAGMAAAEAAYTNAGGRNLSDLVAYNDNRLNQMTERERAADKHRWDGDMNKAQITHMGNQDKIGFANVAVANRNAAVNERQVTVQEAQAMGQQQDRLENRLAKLREERSDTFKASAGSEKGWAAVQDAIKFLPDKNDQEQARLAAAKAIKENPNATTESVIRATMGMNTKWYTPDAMDRSDFIKTVSQSNPNTAEMQAMVARRGQVDSSIDAVKQQLAKLAGAPGTSLPPTAAAPVTTVPNPFDSGASAAAMKAMDKDLPPSMQPAPAAPPPVIRTPREQVEADYTNAMADYDKKYSGPNQYGIFSKEGQAERAAIVQARLDGRSKVEADEKAAAKAAFQARADEANRRNGAMVARQDAINAKAVKTQKERQVNNIERKIADLQTDLKVYQKRGSVRDKIDIDDTNEELTKAMAERDRLKKLLGN